MHTSISMSINDDLDLVYTTGVGVKTAKQSLDGTRMGILNEVVNWIDNQTPTTLKVCFMDQLARVNLLLHLPSRYKDGNWCKFGSYFCFSRARHAEQLYQKLFPTIARDAATHELNLNFVLVDILAVDLGHPMSNNSSKDSF